MEFTELQRAVIKQLQPDNLEDLQSTLADIAGHGIDGGFQGFIYTRDTVRFHDEHEPLLWTELEQEANDVGGGNALAYVATFNTQATDIDSLKNLVSWWAAEKVARELTDDSDFMRLEESEYVALVGGTDDVTA